MTENFTSMHGRNDQVTMAEVSVQTFFTNLKTPFRFRFFWSVNSINCYVNITENFELVKPLRNIRINIRATGTSCSSLRYVVSV